MDDLGRLELAAAADAPGRVAATPVPPAVGIVAEAFSLRTPSLVTASVITDTFGGDGHSSDPWYEKASAAKFAQTAKARSARRRIIIIIIPLNYSLSLRGERRSAR